MAGSYYGHIGYVFMVGSPRVRCVSTSYSSSNTSGGVVTADATAAAGDVAIIFASALHTPTIAIDGAPALLAAHSNADTTAKVYSETLTAGALSRTVTLGANSLNYIAMIVLESVHPPLDANTMFLMLWDSATPREKRFGTIFDLVGNAAVDVANNELVLDGVGDWAIHQNVTPGLIATPDWTIEWFMNVAANQFGGPFAHRNNQPFAPFLPGNGNMQMYVLDGSPLLTVAGVDGARHHWAFTCENGSPFRYRVYRDGIQVGTTTSGNGHSMNDLATMYFGTDPFDTLGRDIAGRFGPMRVSNVCRYPNGTAFAPPAINAWA
jgi:hypothetical protein